MIIDPELKALIPPLAPEELAQLEANILADGCRDPLVTWHGILIDGHNRFAICSKHGLGFETVAMEFESRAHVRVWMRDNQGGRRNLSAAWKIELELGNKADLLEIGKAKRVESLKQNAAVLSENDTTVSPPVSTRAELAKAAGVSTGQVGMAEQVKKKSPELWEKAKAGEVSISAAYKAVNTHVSQNSGENEWYTPPQFIESARLVMGSIDTDPASNPIANATVKATRFFTKDEDGLQQKWEGNVWMNPPYAQPLMSQFAEAISEKFESGEIEQAIILVNNATETQWFQRMASVASAVCFPKSRVKFLDPNGKPGAPLQGQAIIYMGDSKRVFRDEFRKYGAIFA
jgi:ParB family chromosome partitioning protein